MLDWMLVAGVAAIPAAGALWAFAAGIRSRHRVRALLLENAALRLQADEGAAASHARSRFLAMMSHEIRTPLTGIVGFAEVLGDEPLSESGRRSLESIRRASRSLQALLGDILDFSRIDAGALPMQSRPTDLEALLLEVRDEFAPQARQRGLGFGLSIADDARRWTETDPLRLRQVVVNLVSNAIRYTDSGMIRITAGIDAADPDRVIIRVSDTGLGIAPEECERIFDAFARAAESDATQTEDGGVGLGLAIADGLVRAMGGALSLESTVGHGSTFTVTLPLPACVPPAAPAAVRTEKALSAVPARILLVDDVAMNRELFAAMLSRAGHRVTTAEDGETALQRLSQSRFDLAFIDIQMPFMDGLELTRRIRASEDPVVAGLPLIALSAAAYGEDRLRAEAAGMDDYVTKPATREDIAAAVARIQDRTRVQPPADKPASQVTAPTRPEVLDRRAFDSQRAIFGDERILHFLSLLEDELVRRVTEIDNLPVDDRAGLARHAHSVASAAGNLGFMTLLFTGRSLEREIPTMPADKIDEAVAAFLGDIAAAIDTIAALRAEIAPGAARQSA